MSQSLLVPKSISILPYRLVVVPIHVPYGSDTKVVNYTLKIEYLFKPTTDTS